MQACRFAAQEIEDCVITILIDALMTPARLLEALAIADISGDQVRKLLGRGARLAATLRGAPGERGKLIRALVERVIIDENRIAIKVRRGALLAGNVPADASENSNGGTIEFTAAVDFKRRGVASKIVVPGLLQQNQASKCDPALIKAIARGRAWFDELAAGRARSLRELAERDGITRRYVRRLVGLAFLSPQLIDAILQGRQPVALTATRLAEFDLPFDWTEQHKLLAT
jgi:hypothetical protein